jgi:hypothetical protein
MHTEWQSNEVVGSALRALPTDDAMPCSWLEFQRRQAQATRSAPFAVPAAAAAVAVLAVAALALWARRDHGEAVSQAAPVAVVASTAGSIEDTRAAERWLESLPREPAVVRVGTRADVLRLEDRIAQVDDLLSAGRAGSTEQTHLLALQRERAQLVGALARVRYAEFLAAE